MALILAHTLDGHLLHTEQTLWNFLEYDYLLLLSYHHLSDAPRAVSRLEEGEFSWNRHSFISGALSGDNTTAFGQRAGPLLV